MMLLHSEHHNDRVAAEEIRNKKYDSSVGRSASPNNKSQAKRPHWMPAGKGGGHVTMAEM
jgi:hypothetical protein